jgi:phage terminase small subunit
MGSRGPKPKAEVRLLHRANRSGPVMPDWPMDSKLPQMPSHLHGFAKTLWCSLGPQLAAEGLLNELFKNSFAVLCSAWGHAMQIEKELSDLPANSDPKIRVSLRRLLIQQQKLVHLLSGEFGLSPNMRGRVQAERRPPMLPSPWDQFGCE